MQWRESALDTNPVVHLPNKSHITGGSGSSVANKLPLPLSNRLESMPVEGLETTPSASDQAHQHLGRTPHQVVPCRRGAYLLNSGNSMRDGQSKDTTLIKQQAQVYGNGYFPGTYYDWPQQHC